LNAHRIVNILWPAFLMAGVLEILVFAQVDPGELHNFGSSAAAWPPQAIYSLAFLVFWAVIAIASALTLWLASPPAPGDSAG
jgi:uncharacterized membrane protein YcfT